MQKSKIHFLIINFFIVIVFNSCVTYNVGNDFKQVTLLENHFTNPYFSNAETDYVYKTNISVYGNELTGIFIAKKINETTHRVVFTTEFGNKLLDFEISETDFKINSIVDDLNKKILISTLKNDFRLILGNKYNIKEQLENETNTVYKSIDGGCNNYIFINKSNQNLYKIIASNNRKEKINITFTSDNSSFAKNIVIQHYNIKLRIELNHFKLDKN